VQVWVGLAGGRRRQRHFGGETVIGLCSHPQGRIACMQWPRQCPWHPGCSDHMLAVHDG
jgi:hypothetical protein